MAYFGDTNGLLYGFSFNPSTQLFNQTPVVSSISSVYPAPQVSYTSNGLFNGILWCLTAVADGELNPVGGVLHALNPLTLSELYNTTTNAGDALGNISKFSVPLVIRGRVYISTQAPNVKVYGL
jgi:hypothetical protein